VMVNGGMGNRHLVGWIDAWMAGLLTGVVKLVRRISRVARCLQSSPSTRVHMASSISCKPWPKLLYLHWVAIKLRLGPNPSVRACAGQEAGCRPVEEGQGFPAGYLGQVKHARTSSYARTRNWFRKRKDIRSAAMAAVLMRGRWPPPARRCSRKLHPLQVQCRSGQSQTQLCTSADRHAWWTQERRGGKLQQLAASLLLLCQPEHEDYCRPATRSVIFFFGL
jgi:hypothetical protein